MKRILVTGANGYIGRSFCKYTGQFPGDYEADAVSLRDGNWKTRDFSRYDSILHAAGLVHRKETGRDAPLYAAINRDLTAELAEKARAEGVRQMVFLSTFSVYGMDEGMITRETVPHPKSSYGQSKLEAERLLLAMETELFRVAVLRVPMVYGPGCKGNYQTLIKLAEILPACPAYENQRSVISIINLCAYIKSVVDKESTGIFFPQDPEYACTCRMIRRIAEENGKRLPQTRLLNFGPILLKRFTKAGRKAFGNLVYRDESQRSDTGV